MKNILIPAALSVLALSAVGSAQAAPVVGTAPVQHPLTVKLGVALPTSSAARNLEGSTAFSAGVDYAVGKTTEANPTLPSVYFDYNGGSKNSGHIYNYGLGVAIRAYATKPSGNVATGSSFYYGAGVGVYRAEGKDTIGNTANKTGLGGKVLAGVEFSGNLLAEVSYNFTPKLSGTNTNTVGVQLGYRF